VNQLRAAYWLPAAGLPAFQNGSSSREDACGALIGNFFFGFQPVLYVATAELGTFKAKRLAANECDGLGLDLADISRGLFAVHESSVVVCPRTM